MFATTNHKNYHMSSPHQHGSRSSSTAARGRSSSSAAQGGGAVIRRRQVPSRRRRDGLIQFAQDKTSQNGEDGILQHLFSVLLIPDEKRPRFCVDVGAWDGVHLSNTHSLLTRARTRTDEDDESKRSAEWKGVLIEADPDKFKELKALHEPLGNTCISSTVSGNPSSPNSLSSILKQVQQRQRQEASLDTAGASVDAIPNNFDFLCIDIDGMDYWVLLDILRHSDFRPSVICVEFNPTMPSDLIYIPPPPSSSSNNNNHTTIVEEESRHGASLAALVELASGDDGGGHYALIETTLYNAFFVKKSIYQSNEALQSLVPDTSIEALHEMTMGTSLYQLYDGTLKLWGCQKLLWHRLPVRMVLSLNSSSASNMSSLTLPVLHPLQIKESNIQILSPQERNFPFAPSSNATQQVDDSTLYQSFESNNTIIDVHPWCSPASGNQAADDALRASCATALLKQLQKDGFAYVRAPLDVPICQSALELTKFFLQDANENVRRSCLVKDRAKRGYSPFNVSHGP